LANIAYIVLNTHSLVVSVYLLHGLISSCLWHTQDTHADTDTDAYAHSTRRHTQAYISKGSGAT